MSAVSSEVISPNKNTLPDTELREIIRGFGDLPVGVTNARFTQVLHRQLDRDLIHTITYQANPNTVESALSARLERRRSNLRPFVGRFLVCVFIRLPGVHYTIEIDPINREVIHWEWQVE